jgi:hexosaminidase
VVLVVTNIMDLNIIPLPAEIHPDSDLFSISFDTSILYSEKAKGMADYLAGLLRPATGYPFSIEPLDHRENSENTIMLVIDSDLNLLSESYSLSIKSEKIELLSKTEAGIFYGLQTLRQLLPIEIESNEPVPGLEWKVPCLEILDQPAFSWRGLHLDVSRHMYPMEFLKKFFDMMALHKLNVFHWHLTDDQGWRIEIQKYPRLVEIGAYRESTPIPYKRGKADNQPYGGFYSQNEVRELVSYASQRNITIVPEIEMPGHALAALAAYPEYGCAGEAYKVGCSWGMKDEVFCAGNEELYPFLEDILDEVIELFPGDFIHIGGDECPKVSWKACPKCQNKIEVEGLKDEFELQSYFIRRIGKYLNSKGKRIIGWDETLEGGLAPNAAVMSWRGIEGGISAALRSHDVVMTPNTHCYFDYYQSLEYDTEPPALGGYISLDKVYEFDPCDGIPFDNQKYILGGQGNIWTEFMPTSKQVEYMAYPRASALAEVLWSGPGNDISNFLDRMEIHSKRLKSLGVNFRPLD